MEAPRPTLLTPRFAVLNKPLVQKAKDVLPEITKTRQGPPRLAGELVSVCGEVVELRKTALCC